MRVGNIMVPKQLRVALVDDEISFLDYSSALLDGSDEFEVVYKTLESQDALNDIPNNDLDFVVIDVNMPKLNGFILSHRLLKEQPNLKIVIVSDSHDSNFITLSEDIGAAAFLPKEQFNLEAFRSLAHAS